MQKLVKKFAIIGKFRYLCSLKSLFLEMIHITHGASLLPYNTFGMEVKAAVLAEYDTLDELQQLLDNEEISQLMQRQRKAGRLPFWHIGGGSNLLFAGDYQGVIFHCNAKGIDRSAMLADGSCLLTIEAGTCWDDVCAYCAEEGLYGTENLSLIPGETGAAAVQNIGAYGVEFGHLVEQVICWDLEQKCKRIFSAEEMHYGYRESLLKHDEAKSRYIVNQVVIKVSKEPVLHLGYAGLLSALGLTETPTEEASKPTALEVRQAVIRIREGKLPDPKQVGNAGSFFKNPVVENSLFERLLQTYPAMPHYKVDEQHTKIPAGWMIEQCGWKGRSLGRAGVYEKQSLVLVNRGGATPEEIVTLCNTIVSDVEKCFGIRIEPEVNMIL